MANTNTNVFSKVSGISLCAFFFSIIILSGKSYGASSCLQSAATIADSPHPIAPIAITLTAGEAGQSISAQAISLPLATQTATKSNPADVTTYHYDVARDGLNANETILNLANVNSVHFGKIGFYSVDAKVDAEPLFLANVPIEGHFHNVLYVATEHDSVYAFDADSGVQMWKATVLGSGETTSDDRGCTQITPEIGITATPVIDRNQGANGTLFAVGMSKDANGKYHQRLHALDVTTGIEADSPTEITASYPGSGDNSQNGSVVFDPSQFAERAALLMLNGNIYTAWTSHCDKGLYTGWVIAYSESTLQQTHVLNVTPNGHEGSIWMSGDGLAADASGNIYFLDANGTFDATLNAQTFPTSGDYGNAMLKLSTSGGKLAVADYFEMYNTGTESADDIDLGSGGELLLQDQKDAAGAVHHLIVGAGKDRNIYLADRDNMGKFNPADNPQDSNIYQEITGQLSGPVFSSPAYFNGTLYYGSVSDTLKAFPLNNAVLGTSPSSQSAVQFPYPGTTPGISANGSQNGIVWAVESNLMKPGVLHAFDAANLAHELYNSGQAANGRDSFGNGNKFITPMIANGKVYVGTPTGVAVFGLLFSATLTSPAPSSTLTGSSVTFAWSAGGGVTDYYLFLGSEGVGSNNLYSSGYKIAKSVKVTGLPLNGETVYARLYSLISGSWHYLDYTYTAASQAMLTSPAPNSTLTGSSVAFTWSAGAGITEYYLFLGSNGVGSNNLYSSGYKTTKSVNVTGLPVNGETVYARLYWFIDGSWRYLDYTYTAK